MSVSCRDRNKAVYQASDRRPPTRKRISSVAFYVSYYFTLNWVLKCVFCSDSKKNYSIKLNCSVPINKLALHPSSVQLRIYFNHINLTSCISMDALKLNENENK